jgi:hypothetical protein
MNNKNKIYISTLVIFWITFSFSILILLNIFILNSFDLFNRFLFYLLAISLPFLGIALIVLTVKAGFKKIQKTFFILTGASAIGMVIGAALHNLVYAIFIKLFGEGFWSGTGDEPVFFIFATIVCPIALFIGAIGSMVLIARKEVKT